MRIPVNVSGQELLRRLERFGYAFERQKGSHMTCTTRENGEHHAYIPDDRPISVGTLRNILKDIAEHFGISLSELIRRLEL
jgi:predicted RNA binding protein YcfA (HicA-like mRNA interferase family)